MNPTAPPEREPVLDVLRGFAVLGIFVVNLESMRGSDWLMLLSGHSLPPHGRLDAVLQFAIGWLAAGKFVSCLALLFGLGAGIIAERASRTGESPRRLLARRYAWLAVFGVAHTPIFAGDILLLYGITGLALLAFAASGVKTLVAWSLALLALYTVIFIAGMSAPVSVTYDRADGGFAAFVEELWIDTVEAFTAGTVFDMLRVQVQQALLLHPGQLTVLPWVLALFLLGCALARAGVLKDLRAHRAMLRVGALAGLGVGLPANFVLGWLGPYAGFGVTATHPQWIVQWGAVAHAVGTPVLAIGYLCALSLFCLRRPVPALAAVGRMALTAYLLQSVVALAIFGGLRLYDTLSTASALVVAALVWAMLLVLCPWWLSRFRFGPAEWLWRALTYKAPRVSSR